MARFETHTSFKSSVVDAVLDREMVERLLPKFDPDILLKKINPTGRRADDTATKRELSFVVICNVGYATTPEVLKEMERLHLRPALLEEFLGILNKESLDEQDAPMVVLSSESRLSNFRDEDESRWIIEGRLISRLSLTDSGWPGKSRFLFVCK